MSTKRYVVFGTAVGADSAPWVVGVYPTLLAASKVRQELNDTLFDMGVHPDCPDIQEVIRRVRDLKMCGGSSDSIIYRKDPHVTLGPLGARYYAIGGPLISSRAVANNG